MEQAQRDALTQNWDQAKDQLKAQFGLDDADVENPDADALVTAISAKTGSERAQVEQDLDTFARQYDEQAPPA